MPDRRDVHYSEFGISSFEMLPALITGTEQDVVDAAYISRAHAEQAKYEDNDRTEDTLRHLLLGGLIELSPEQEETIGRDIASFLIDFREGDAPEDKIDLNNNIYGRRLREMYPDREEFIAKAIEIADSLAENGELPEIDGVVPEKSYGRFETPERLAEFEEEEAKRIYTKGPDGNWILKEDLKKAEMDTGGLMLAPGGGVLKSAVKAGEKMIDDVDTSYRMMHQPRGPEDDTPIRLDDLTRSTTGESAGYPEDFYTAQGKSIYAPGPSFQGDEYGIANNESYNIIRSVKDNPEAEITIYRAVPDEDDIDTINRGDFVTLSKTYADLHAASGYGRSGQDAGKVIAEKVKVKDLYWDGNDVNEFGYFPQTNKTKSIIAGLSGTAIALGLVATPEEAEAAYIPLKAFAEGSDAAKAFFQKAQKRIDEGADTAPNGELYNEMGVYKSEDGDLKVDVPELRARDVEAMSAIGNFQKDLEFYLKSPKKVTKKFNFPITRYLPEDSPIFENFPELKNMDVEIAPRSTQSYKKNVYANQGFYEGPHPSNNFVPKIVITVPTSDPKKGVNLERDLTEDEITKQVLASFNTFIHEFQHHIQDVKKASSVGYNQIYAKEGLKGFINDYEDAVKALEKLQPGDIGYDQFKNKVDSVHQLVADSFRSDFVADEFFKSDFSSQVKEAKKQLKSGKLSWSTGFEITLRELGEAEARSSALKAFLPAGEARKSIGIFYPTHRNETNTILLDADEVPVKFQLNNTHVLVRAFPETEYPTAADKLSFPETVMGKEIQDAPTVAKKKQEQQKKGEGPSALGPAAVAGTAVGLASPPSEAFVAGLGVDDPTPTASLFDVADGAIPNELGITNTFLLDLLVPRTKPYDIISNTPLGVGMMAGDLVDLGFGDFLRGKGTEAGQRIRAEAQDEDNQGLMSDGP